MYYVIHHGRRLVHLQKCPNLINPFHNVSAFSSASVVSSQGKTFTVSYLIGSLGFTTKLAESISRKVSFEDTCNADSVLSLLRSHGFKDSQISNIIRDYPRLLVLDADKSISPKLKFLLSREGTSTPELTEILSQVPKIFGIKKDKATSVYYDFAKEIIEADKSSEFVKLSHSYLPLEGSKQGNKMRNVSVLRELGVPQKMLFSLICNYRVCCGKEERFEESVKKVVEMGFDPTTSKFVRALQAFYEIGEKTIEDKVNVYKKLGFDVEDVWAIFRKYPMCLTFSEKKVVRNFETMKRCGLLEHEVRSVVKSFPQCIVVSENNIENSVETFLGLGFSRDEFAMMLKRGSSMIGLSAETVKKKTEFVVKQMNWPLKALVSYPQVFGYSMEKRILPRCNVIKALMSKRLVGPELPSLWSVLICTNEVFLKRFVRKHDDKELVSELMAVFREKNK